MKSHKIFQLGLSVFEEIDWRDYSHEDCLAMVAGRILKAEEADPSLAEFPLEELREDAERAAAICLALATRPQSVFLK